MFTGLVESVGTITDRKEIGGGIRFRMQAQDIAGEMTDGDSLAVDGVCHTIFDVGAESFSFESIRTTLSRTTLGEMEVGRLVNLERAMRTGDEFGGHLVQGHVDGVGTVTGLERAEETVFIRVQLHEEVARLSVLYGSIAIDGISLTINTLEDEVAEVAIIPYTWNHTNVGRLSAGVHVNLEADMIGKYVDRLLDPYMKARERSATVSGGPV
jgi:riboflavin synthase